MHRYIAGPLLALSLALSGPLAACAPILTPSQQVTSAKAEYAFEAAYNTAAHAYLDGLDAGIISPEAKAKAKPLLQRAYKAVLAARKAQALGEADNFATQSGLAMSLASQVLAIVKP